MKFTRLFILFIALSTLISCSKNENIPTDIEVQTFVWKGLNAYYLWQGEIPDLSDRRFSADQQLYSYLQGFSNPENLFESLLFERGVTDKFSWIVDDYIALENSFEGTTETSGMEFGLRTFENDATKVYGYVRYVVPGTDAENKGVTRGMIFTQVNGTALTQANYRSLLFSSSTSYTIQLADFNSGNPTENGTEIALDKSQFTENSVHTSAIFNEGTNKIGYLMYNAFTPQFDDELNDVFANFKSELVTDLIIDLRYNGGGSVRTATYLASMITGQFNGDVFSKQRWNSKVEEATDPSNFINNFTNQIDNGIVNQQINSLNLENIYFITTGSSASASELVINGLVPHINVKQVGTKTFGKYVGSITLYDSPNFNKTDVNPNHNWAMQPIVLEIVNKDGNNDKDGIEPTVEFPEDYGNLGVLGDRNEPLLDRTITLITTGARGVFTPRNTYFGEEISNSKLHTPTSNNMYVELK
ncbi:S41 family peptidase [Tenacibaculum aquimarinum]|uniref:S41 family peptidase n=1 Tax=Tenacibaculum aquimarinum TaxID=2910675 RepID=UPI001F0AC7B1|nr:S41 family peptidase [Tenacibaculum aquimarinum]MCH3885242.1 S41 family peptidase [Tenacibaculum aquimarinum]